MHIDDQALIDAAWSVREFAHVIGPTKVGCAVRSESGTIYTGCNVEHRFRSHDVHAEVNAISTMVASGGKTFAKLAIAAERARFTPCGACLDWIFQFAEVDTCEILCQSHKEGQIVRYKLTDLMPYYPH